MFEDDFFSKYSSTTTTSEETSQETYRPQTDYSANSQQFDDDQDYSVTQNFTEQKSYNSVSQNTFEEEDEQEQRFETPSLNAPVIQRSEPTVNLIKKRAKLVLETRMKVVVAVFSMLVACLLFISIFNFIQVGKIESQFASKQIEIANLEKSITDSKATYTLVSDDEYLRQWAETNEFVETNDTNTIVVDISEFYEQPAGPEAIQSNWFNDVCEFLSRLFA
ncbi:MAG: hypothetical protein E7341_04660 [Clostridiales bacterium]|nr:hypothetical protein [Clostridiales bacterium]